jgi:hypothetical protein
LILLLEVEQKLFVLNLLGLVLSGNCLLLCNLLGKLLVVLLKVLTVTLLDGKDILH